MICYNSLSHDLRIIFESIEMFDFAFVIARPDFKVDGEKFLEDGFPLTQTIFFAIIVKSIHIE